MDLKQLGIEMIKKIKSQASCELPYIEGCYNLLYLQKGKITVSINGLSFGVTKNEMFFITPDDTIQSIKSDGRTVSIHLSFLLKDGFLNMLSKETASLKKSLNNLIIRHTEGSSALLYLLEEAAYMNQYNGELGYSYIASNLCLFFIKLVKSSIYYAIPGIDWMKYNADALQVYIKSGNRPISMTLRMDYYTGDIVEGALAKNLCIADLSGNIIEKHTYGAHTVNVPKEFEGYMVIPFNKGFWLENREKGIAVESYNAELNKMCDLAIYIYPEYPDGPPPLGEIMSIGAMCLIKYVEDSGKIIRKTIKNLSYQNDDTEKDERFLKEKHIMYFFNHQYEGQKIYSRFANGLISINCEALINDTAIICTVMGCKNDNDRDLPADIALVKRRIDAEPERNYEIRDMAGWIFLSESRFKMKFKEYLGVSPMAYVTKIKISEAKKLLKDNNVTKTAFKLGFTSSSYFSKVFQKTVGMSPQQWRDIIKKKI